MASVGMVACKIGLQAPVAALLGAAIGASAPAEISVGALGVALAAMGIKIDNATLRNVRADILSAFTPLQGRGGSRG